MKISVELERKEIIKVIRYLEQTKDDIRKYEKDMLVSMLKDNTLDCVDSRTKECHCIKGYNEDIIELVNIIYTLAQSIGEEERYYSELNH